MQTYIAGNIIENTATFTADDNVTPVDPTTVKVIYQVTSVGSTTPDTITYAGSSTPATNAIARLSTGTYVVRIDTSLLPGYWKYQWFGSGTGQANLPLSATVYPSPF